MTREVEDRVRPAEGLHAAARQEIQPDGEDVDRAQAEHEGRNAREGHRHRRHPVIGLRVRAKRGKDPERDPDQHRDQDRDAHERQRGRDPLGDLLRDGPVGLDGVAEIALDGAPQPEEIADRHGLVQAELLPALLEKLRVPLDLREHGRIHARCEWVTRRERQRDEAHDGDPQQDRERDEDPSQDVGRHPAASGRLWRPDGRLDHGAIATDSGPSFGPRR